ncbi:hypothetical protein [Paraburkholderia sartisoli]|uniref:Pyrroloquinoline quinone biosynthesis protein B n=1 Tax=Paraburkholderia sartisoli TaxID=83784 RepID=A0A1H4H523_9BURK|nr:hypothetical protein SAMN05192564_107181 [Paraburkholderia sartisoli]
MKIRIPGPGLVADGGLPQWNCNCANRSRTPGIDVAHHFRMPEAQRRAAHILLFRIDLPWSMLDAPEKAYPV